MTIYNIMYSEWFGRGKFLGKGNFSELNLALTEVCVGTHLSIVGSAGVKQSMLLERFDDAISIYSLGSIFLISGLLSLTGILLFYLDYTTMNGYKTERLLRFLGALTSIFVWMASGITLFPSAFCYVYFSAVLASMRVTMIVWRK